MKYLKLSHFSMICCKKQLLWLGEKEPRYCPECGRPAFYYLHGGTHRKGKKITNFKLILESQVVIVEQLEEKE